MKLVVKLVAVVGGVITALLALAVFAAWMMVPMNAPWTSMLQQMSALPAWLEPSPMTSARVENQLSAADGYGVSLFATEISDARVLRITAAGDVLVSSPGDGWVVRLDADRDGDGESDGREVLLDGLTRPNGLDIANGYLYIAEEDGIGRVAFDSHTGDTAGDYVRIIEGLPPGGNHWKKTVRVGPDGLLYVAIGSSCNVCIEDDPRRAAILRYTTEGEFLDLFATGLRNSAGFDWSPATGTMYATDNGRDLLGDDFPPCELNAVVEGGFYGWPFANGAKLPDPDMGEGQDDVIASSIAPAHGFRAHNAPLGIVFLRHDNHPRDYRGAAIVALHGSWNRTKKDGYKVVSLHFADDGSIEERDFLTGFLTDDVAIGRPTEVAEGPDGSVYISDDLGRAIYRVEYGASGSASIPGSTRLPSEGYDPTSVSAAERASAMTVGPGILANEACLVCHGESAATDAAQIPLVDLGMRYTIGELVEYLAAPRPPMPPFDADAERRRALAIYLLETY